MRLVSWTLILYFHEVNVCCLPSSTQCQERMTHRFSYVLCNYLCVPSAFAALVSLITILLDSKSRVTWNWHDHESWGTNHRTAAPVDTCRNRNLKRTIPRWKDWYPRTPTGHMDKYRLLGSQTEILVWGWSQAILWNFHSFRLICLNFAWISIWIW